MRMKLAAEERRRLARAGDMRRHSNPGFVAAEQARRFAAGRLTITDRTVADHIEVGGVRYPLPPIGTPLFIRNKGLVAWGIATGTRSPFNHIGMYVGWASVSRERVPAVLEARSSGAMLTPLTDFITSRRVRRAEWGVVPEFRQQAQRNVAKPTGNPQISAEETRLRIAAANEGMGMLGTPYGWTGVVAIGFLQFGIDNGWVDRHVRAMDNAFCSQLYAWSVISAGVKLNGVGIATDRRGQRSAPDVWGVSPGDIARHRHLRPLTAAASAGERS